MKQSQNIPNLFDAQIWHPVFLDMRVEGEGEEGRGNQETGGIERGELINSYLLTVVQSMFYDGLRQACQG